MKTMTIFDNHQQVKDSYKIDEFVFKTTSSTFFLLNHGNVIYIYKPTRIVLLLRRLHQYDI